MAKTIAEGFKKLRENLEITDLQESTVSKRQINVRQALEKELVVNDTFLTGSYRRSTMIAPLKEADVDIFAVLDVKYHKNGIAAVPESVKKALRTAYTTPEIRPDGQAVTIIFSDFKVDVVPAFYSSAGGFLIPNTTIGLWIGTDPKKHVELWTASNKLHNGDLVPLIKMIKGWNKSRSVLKSFHLEVLTRHVLSGIRIDDFASGVRYVLDKARDHIRSKLADPAGFNDDVGAYVNTTQKMDKIIEHLDRAYDIAVKAEASEAVGKTSEAFAKWQTLFGTYFPAYG